MAPKKTVRATRTRTKNHKAAQEVLVAVQERKTTSPEGAKVATRKVAALKESTKPLAIEADLSSTVKIRGMQNALRVQIVKLVELGRKGILTALYDEHKTKVAQYVKEMQNTERMLVKQQGENEAMQEKLRIRARVR